MKSIFKNCSVALFGTLLGLLSITAAPGQSTIGVSPFAPTDHADGINYSGGSNPALDETFTVSDNDPVLNSVSLYTTTVTNAEAGLNASLYQWSQTTDTPVGSAVWSSTTPQTITASNDSIPVLVTFATDGVQLDPADDYILEFTAYNSALVTGTPAIFEVDQATYANGIFVAFGSNTYYPQTGSNLDFTASFTPTPEPSTWALLLGGLGLLAFWHQRMRRA
jgi:hypothetical protein